jgi:Uma2 family endonuclease
MTQLLERPVQPPRAMPISVEQYEFLGQQGLLPRRVELVKGVIVEMASMGDDHVAALDTLNLRLMLRFHTRARVTSQTPVRLIPAFGEPEPDLMLCKLGSKGVTNPEDVLLLLEIAKSTYTTDRDDKLPMYAQCGIPEVWIHNLNNNTLEVYRNPHLVSSGWVYDLPLVFAVGQPVAPLAFPEDLLEWW